MQLITVAVSLAMGASAYDFSWAPDLLSGDTDSGLLPAPEVPEWTAYFANLGPAADISTSNDITDCTAPGDLTLWGATFDDGPSDATSAVLDYFDGVQMQASFWVIGSNVLNYPDSTQRAYQAGHHIGTHTWTHNDLTTLSDDQVISELVLGSRAVLEATGVLPKYFRPPYGAINDNVRALAASMGLISVTWNLDSQDWTYVGSGDMPVADTFQNWMDQDLSQAITLEHDGFDETAAVIPDAMNVLLENGKTVVPVSVCVGDANPYDNAVLQAFFASGLFEAAGISGAGSSEKDAVVGGDARNVTAVSSLETVQVVATIGLVAVGVMTLFFALVVVLHKKSNQATPVWQTKRDVEKKVPYSGRFLSDFSDDI